MNLATVRIFTKIFMRNIRMPRVALVIAIALLAFSAHAATMPAVKYIAENGAKQTVDFSKNRLTALHFWATWCSPCVEEFPQVSRIQEKYQNRGFQVIALSLDTQKEQVKKFFAEENIRNLAPLFDGGNSQALKIRGLPTTIFVNSSGEAIARIDGAVDWQSEKINRFIERNL